MNQPITRHEDDRRVLIEWIRDMPVRSCKIVIAKNRQHLGKHYHNNKDELFYILKGKGIVILSGPRVYRTWLFEGDSVFIPKGVHHTFELWPDTIMLGAATAPFDSEDEIQVPE